jgi:hypothetical protein
MKPQSVSFDGEEASDEEEAKLPEDLEGFIEDLLASEVTLYLEKTGTVPPLHRDLLHSYLQALFVMLEPQTEEFLDILNRPEEPDYIELLASIQSSEIGCFSEPPVLELYIPGHFSTEINGQLGVSSRQLDHDNISQAFANSLYHAVNEGLNHLRKGGLRGVPPQWSHRAVSMKQYKTLEQVYDDLEALLVKWDSFRAGPLCQDGFLTQTVSTLREDKMSAWLCSAVREEEASWLEYEGEELQVKLDLADIMLEQLVEETLSLLGD